MDTARVIGGAAFAATWQVMGHYLPVSKPFERPSVPARIAAYTYGVTGIACGVGLAFGLRAMLQVFGMAIPAGIVTILAYAADHIATAPARELVRRGFES